MHFYGPGHRSFLRLFRKDWEALQCFVTRPMLFQSTGDVILFWKHESVGLKQTCSGSGSQVWKDGNGHHSSNENTLAWDRKPPLLNFLCIAFNFAQQWRFTAPFHTALCGFSSVWGLWGTAKLLLSPEPLEGNRPPAADSRRRLAVPRQCCRKLGTNGYYTSRFSVHPWVIYGGSSWLAVVLFLFSSG